MSLQSRCLVLMLFGPALHCHCSIAAFCCSGFVTAVSLHFPVVVWSSFPLSSQCRCIVLLMFGPASHYHCSFGFCVAGCSFALSLRCRCILPLMLGPVFRCHCCVAASCCCCVVQSCIAIAASHHFAVDIWSSLSAPHPPAKLAKLDQTTAIKRQRHYSVTLGQTTTQKGAKLQWQCRNNWTNNSTTMQLHCDDSPKLDQTMTATECSDTPVTVQDWTKQQQQRAAALQ